MSTMENKISEWLGLARRGNRSGQVLLERSIRLPRVLMVAAGRRVDDAASIQADLAFDQLRADGWSVGRCNLGRISKASGRGESAKLNGSRISCLKELARSLPRWDVVHVFVSTLGELVSFSMPAVLLGRFFGRKIVVHVYSPHFGEWLDRWGRLIVPVLRQADVVAVPKGGNMSLIREHKLRITELPGVVDNEMSGAGGEAERLQPRMLTTRALEPHANPTLVLKAFKIVKQKYPRAELVIVGEGSQRDELTEWVDSERINGVTFSGVVQHADMAGFYNRADLYINGSFRSDIPVSLLEAQACGLPVVSLGQHEKHLRCDVKSHIDLADLILYLVENPDEVKRLLSASEADREASGWAKCRNSWTNLYLDLAGRSGR
jgi:phenylacetate-CoA ligase